MITNKKLYEMIEEQINHSNEDLREKLKMQIAEKSSATQTLAQELADRHAVEINNFSAEMHQQWNALQSEIQRTAENQSEIIIQKLMQDYSQKTESLKSELFEKLDENFEQVMNASKSLADGIANLQKDTAVIMETLQLILTNMMLDKVEIKDKNL